MQVTIEISSPSSLVVRMSINGYNAQDPKSCSHGSVKQRIIHICQRINEYALHHLCSGSTFKQLKWIRALGVANTVIYLRQTASHNTNMCRTVTRIEFDIR